MARPEWTWAIGARAPGHAAVEREVAVPERPWDQQVRLEVPPGARATGRLGVELVDEEGSSLPYDVLTLALPRSGLHVMQLEGASGAPGGPWHDAPAGTWRIVVYPAGTLAFSYAGFQRPVVSQVDVHIGEPTTARLVSRLGGRLRVAVRLAEGVREPVSLTVEASRGDGATADPDTGGIRVWSSSPGKAHVTDVLDPGPWRLRGSARAPELESEVVRVDVVPGRTADVELVVRPR